MLEERDPINLAACQRAFPHVFAGYGDGALARQIDAYNGLLNDGHRHTQSSTFISFLLSKKRLPTSPHMALMNLMSVWNSASRSSPRVRAVLARLFLLESHLAKLESAGVAPSSYRDMLRDPEALDRLIAEVDVAAAFAYKGHFKAHNPNGSGNSNYDIDGQGLGLRLRADVKWYATWVLKQEGEDPLDALLRLIRPDIKAMLYVSLERKQFSNDMLIAAAIEVLHLYDVAKGVIADPGVQVVPDDGKVVALRVRRPHPAKSNVAGVREVTVFQDKEDPQDRDPPPIVVSVSGTAAADEDVNTVRRCLLDAASQVPPASTRGELCAAIVGSANPQDEEDVENALFGSLLDRANRTARDGLFCVDTGETALAHLHAVYYMSLSYEPLKRSNRVVVRRFIRSYSREATPRWRKLWTKAISLWLSRPSLVTVCDP